MIRYIPSLLILSILSLVSNLYFSPALLAQEESTGPRDILTDANGDGEQIILTFGDSITYGIGDGIPAGISVEEVPFSTSASGYPARLSERTGVGVLNSGVPGEVFTEEGSARLISLLHTSPADSFLLMEGTNDAIFRVPPSVYGFELQKVLNIASVLEKQVVPSTLPVPCCEHSGQKLFTDAYSNQVRTLALTNDIPFIDLEDEWKASCPQADMCSFLNIPEGLHPNSSGYDFIADIFAPVFVGGSVSEVVEES